MCRSIRTLHNFQPPATDEEIRAASLQFVRKLCGFSRPSKANEPAFGRAVDQVAAAAHELLASLVAHAPPRDREVETRKARARAAARFGPPRAAPDGTPIRAAAAQQEAVSDARMPRTRAEPAGNRNLS